jgi:nucleotide-binding universal stress UspA family protein
MYLNVLVGIDAEEGGRDAIALAGELVAAGGKITLGHIHAGYPMMGHGASPEFEAAAREQAVEVLKHAGERAGIVADLRAAASASVGRGLHVMADTLNADLLVVGSTRRGVVGRVLLGDETAAALDGASCAVVVAPAGYALHPRVMREIGVAYDESPESEYALGVAHGLSAQLGATLSTFQAIAMPTYASLGGNDWLDLPLDSMLSAARERVGRLEGVEPHVVIGHPAEELSLYSASLDLLVMGSRGYGPVGRLVHGSVTRQLARSARCPLLVLPRPRLGVVTQPAVTQPTATLAVAGLVV